MQQRPGKRGHYSVLSSVRRRCDGPVRAQADSTAWAGSEEVARLHEPGADENAQDKHEVDVSPEDNVKQPLSQEASS